MPIAGSGFSLGIQSDTRVANQVPQGAVEVVREWSKLRMLLLRDAKVVARASN